MSLGSLMEAAAFSIVVDAATDSISQGQNITHSESIVSAGTAELKMDPKQPNEYFIMRGSQMLWRSGVWLQHERIFAMIPEMTLDHIFNYDFYSDENETYFRYSVTYSTVSRQFLDTSGQFIHTNWLDGPLAWFLFWSQPRASLVCDYYAYCGSFTSCSNHSETYCQCLPGFRPSNSFRPSNNLKPLQSSNGGFRPSNSLKPLQSSSGCVRRISLQCEDSSSVNSDEDRFLRMNNVKFPINAKETKLQAAEECKLACFKDCACTAYAYNESAACSLWHGELLNLIQLSTDDPDGQTIYLKLAASELQIPRGEKKLIWVIAIVVVVAVLLPTSYIVYRWGLKDKEMERSQDMLLFDINMSMETSTSELSKEERSKAQPMSRPGACSVNNVTLSLIEPR
ncbi:hypothetical protein QYF36_014572 [Acer negundo]|nr:hypothetical protein QYF36_014572 [Acer negundo]